MRRVATPSLDDHQIDPREFEAKGFKVNSVIKPSNIVKPSSSSNRDAGGVLKIVKIEDQTVTLQSEDGTTEKRMSELMDCYVLRVEDETKVVVLFFFGGEGAECGGVGCWAGVARWVRRLSGGRGRG